jgi:hypothetical protein
LGNLRFTDHNTTLLLTQLANLGTFSNVFVVGSGPGATHDTLQAAFDAVSISSSPSLPSLVLIMPGTYNSVAGVTLSKNAVHVKALGRVVLDTDTGDTFLIDPNVGSPTLATFEGLTFRNDINGEACFRIISDAASTVGSLGIRFTHCEFEAVALGGNYALDIECAGSVTITDCVFSGTGSLCRVQQTANLRVDGLVSESALRFTYSGSGDTPSIPLQPWQVLNADIAGVSPSMQVTTDVVGFEVNVRNTRVGNVSVGTTALLQAYGSQLGNITLNGTSAFNAYGCAFGTFNTNATAQAKAPRAGTASFVAEATKAVTFNIPMSGGYRVTLTPTGDVGAPWVTSQGPNGFTINLPASETVDVDWTAVPS